MITSHPMRPTAAALLCRFLMLALFVAACTASAWAQSSNNTCTNITTNLNKKYPVMTSCYPLSFQKPAAYTAAYNPGGCNASSNDDAYAWFTASSTTTTVTYQPPSGTNAILHVLASCSGPVLACADNGGNGVAETVTFTTVIGTNYIVRVQRKSSDGAMNGTLCIYSPPTCTYRLTLSDSYGDGWADFLGQAYVEVFVNGVSIGLWTLNSGSSGYLDIPVIDGDFIQVVYSDGGAWYYTENSLDLSVAGQCVFQSYTPPNIGLPYAVTVDCTPSNAALAQDCVGGATICGNASITNNSVNSGCALDLNTSNHGCLLSNERQGSWYYFSPSVGGTVGFTITPSGPIDYDFALWGPFDSPQCPTGAPVRCSWADGLFTPTYLTGMGNGAADLSEGAGGDGWVKTLIVVANKVYVLYVDNYSNTGQSFTLDWTLTGGASLDCTTLPVELIDLQATTRNTVIDVTWATATEQNSNYFTVERSPDNEVFSAIGTVGAAGDAQYRNDYLFTDTDPFKGANYYRLKQVDFNGAFERTRTVVAFMGQAGSRPVIFPNPATDVLNVAFGSPLEGSAVLYVQDAVGRTIAESTVVVLRGEQTAVVPTDKLSLGWYNLSIALPDGSLLPGGGFLKK